MAGMTRSAIGTLAALFVCTIVSAEGFKVYPGARVDEKLTREANDLGAKAAAGSKIAVPQATIYTTGEDLEGGVKVRQVAGEYCDTWSINM